MTVTMASEALPWITPPPPLGLSLRNDLGRWNASASQSRTTVSSSVHAGLHSQLNAGAVKAALYISPRIDGYVAHAGKKARKSGDCQCVNPGTIFEAISGWIVDHDSGVSGAEFGRRERRYPGFMLGRTGSSEDETASLCWIISSIAACAALRKEVASIAEAGE